MTSDMSAETFGAKFTIKSHGDVGTLRKHIMKTLSETVNY